MKLEHRRGLSWVLGAALGTAAFNIPWKLATGHGGVAVNTLLLLASAALLSTALTVAQQRRLPRFRRLDLALASALACLTLVANLASATAIRELQPALLTVTQRSEIILVALLAWPVLGERIERRFWIGATVALGGLVILNNPFAASDARATGVAWGLFSAVCFASMAVLTRKFIHQIDVVAVNGLRLWLAVLLWFAWNGIPPVLLEITPAQVGFTSLAAFCGPFAGRICLMNSARYLEARLTTLATLAAPPLTLVFAIALLDDIPTARDLAGGALILCGIAIPILAYIGPLGANPARRR